MYFNFKYIILTSSLLITISTIVSSQHCAKFGRHLLQHQCTLTPEGTEGPYYLPLDLVRRDIRENRTGLPFRLKFTFTDVNTCEPMPNVSVDIWQCDPLGYYSSYTKNSPDKAPTSVLHAPPTDNSTFLRGVQITDKNGVAEFMTVFPGWYAGRTAHIHIQSHAGGKDIHTGQLYFKDSLVSRVARMSPYKQTKNRRYKNADDYIFKRDRGLETIISNIKPMKGRRYSNGLKGEIIIGIDPNGESVNALHGRGRK